MDIKWKIIKKHPAHGSVEVVWWDADTNVAIGPLNVSVLDEAGQCPQDAALHRLIDKHTPLRQFERLAAVAAIGPSGMDHVEAEIDVVRTADLSVLAVASPVPVSQEQPIEPSIHDMEVL